MSELLLTHSHADLSLLKIWYYEMRVSAERAIIVLKHTLSAV